MEKRALLALHDSAVCDLAEDILTRKGFATQKVDSVEAAVAQCDQSPYLLVVMDLNFKAKNPFDISPAREIYRRIEGAVQAGQSAFYGVSGNPAVVDMAKEAGIPALYKPDLAPQLFALQ